MLVIDVEHVFRVFGGPRGLLNALNQYQRALMGRLDNRLGIEPTEPLF